MHLEGTAGIRAAARIAPSGPSARRGPACANGRIRLAFGALAVLLCGCVYLSNHTLEGACSDSLDSPIRNFCVVAPGTIWRGERPTSADAKWLVEHDVGSIVSLQLDDQRAFETAPVAANLERSIAYFPVTGFDPLQMLSRSHLDHHVAHFLAILRQAPKPVYLHCRAGVDRAGVLIAAYRVLVEGLSREQAMAELARFRSPWIHLEYHYVRGLSEARQADIRRQVAEWESQLRPDARIECRSGRCSFVRSGPANTATR
jgi:protein tyrosine/serine phosphatase